jgi:hypothetical protein
MILKLNNQNAAIKIENQQFEIKEEELDESP